MDHERSPIWLATAILGALFIAYQIAAYAVSTNRKDEAARAQRQSPPPPVQLPTVPAAPQLSQVERRRVAAVEEPEPALPPTREIYLCKGYGGGMFWSSAICSTQRATIDRIVNVPRSLSWDEQVTIAEGKKQAAEQLFAPPQSVSTPAEPVPTNADACAAHEQRVRQLDAMARQPQSPQIQDWIRQQRQDTRSRQAALRC